jgi:LPS O-antigen subunit length determinant protein (WzzB/FepE family)
VQQYETVLKTINNEFKVLLARNSELEEQVDKMSVVNLNTGDASTEVIQTQLKQEKLALQRKEEHLHFEIQSLKADKEVLIQQLNNATKFINDFKIEQTNTARV